MTREVLEEDAADSTPLDDIEVTVNVTVLPAVKPVTVIGLELPVAVCPELAVTL